MKGEEGLRRTTLLNRGNRGAGCPKIRLVGSIALKCLIFLGLHLLWCGVELVNIGLSIFVHHSEPLQIATKNHDSLSLHRLDSCRFIRSP